MINEIFDFNNRALGVTPREFLDLDEAQVKFLLKALGEERDELLVAAHEAPTQRWVTVKQVDALIDSAYFAIGGLARAGLTPEQAVACFMAVHKANMTKKLGVTHRGDVGVPDATKPTGWVGPEEEIYQILFGG